MADGVLVYRRQLILPTTFTVTVAVSAIRWTFIQWLRLRRLRIRYL
jgi:hypothetical protein